MNNSFKEMMKHISEITVHILNGEHSEEEMREFMKWYNASIENKKLFFQLKYIYELRNKKLNPDNKELSESWDRLMDKIRSKKEPPIQLKKSINNNLLRKISITGVAAVILILLIVGIRINLTNNNWIEVQSNTPGNIKKIELSDGSTVHLNASSTLKYPKKFNRKSRELFLDGEAYFHVTKDSSRPFVINLDNQQIEVLGTEFNVLAYSTDNIAVTTLISGSVKLTTFETDKSMKDEVILQPGDQAIFDKKTSSYQVVRAETADVTSWIDGEYTFKKKSLEEITNRLEKIYHITFIIQDESLKDKSYTGKFFSYQTVDEVVDILNFKNDIHYEIDNDTVLLYQK
ncbi:MAG: FecR domain-containing protein [Bacteroidales bacterium]|nr:FecR domain-containing protein [Bacteroidales bacterium]MDD3908987.1 FecR domain-containing protein [Proteiniphilum sp.]